LPTASDDRNNTDIQAVAIGEAYGADHYHDDIPGSRWRDGLLVLMAVLALAVLACQRAAESPHFGACNFPHLAGWRSAVFLISASVFRRSTTTLDRGGRG
jgi:hypothetical protein